MTDDIKKIIAENIKRLRKSKNQNAIELAEAIGVSQSTISDWENANKMPRAGSIEKLAQHFNVNKSEILTINSDNTTQNNNETDLSKMLDNVMSFDGEPITDHDREIIMAFLEGKFGKK